jgi:hypothetical protein
MQSVTKSLAMKHERTRQLLDVRKARIDGDAGVSGWVLNLLHAFIKHTEPLT